MTTQNPESERWSKIGLQAYRKVKLNRSYALTDDSKIGLGSLAAAWIESNRNSERTFDQDKFVSFIEKDLAPLLPQLVQQKPGTAPPLPKIWTDPISGQQAVNPYAKGSFDLKAQAIVEQRDPALAEHL